MESLKSFDEVLAAWTDDKTNVYRQRETWDAAAPRWEDMPIPSWEEDPFLRMLDEEVEFDSAMTVLDIGCGSGVYSLAIAPRVASVVGVDLSPKMVEAAQRRAVVEGVENVSFVAGDFLEVPFDGAFDVVFAHMTPAIRDGVTFKKMLSLASVYCSMTKPCRRTDSVLDAVKGILGITPKTAFHDEAVLRAFYAVWQLGMTPSVRHRHEQWKTSRPLDEALSFYRDRQIPKDVSSETFDAVTRYIESLAVGGEVTEVIDTEIAIMGWRCQ